MQAPPPPRAPIRLLSLAFALYAAAGGLVSFAGWLTGTSRLIDWWDTGITVKANTAACIMLAGTATMLLQAPGWRRSVQVLAAICGLVGGATLLEHLLQVDLRIDTLLFDEPAGSPATSAPGRMGPPAALSFLLLSLSICLAARGSPSPLSVAAPLVVLLLSLLSMIGYAYGAEAMYTLPRITGIAVQTATMIAALATALLASQPTREPMRTFLDAGTAGVLARRLLPLAIAVPVLLGWLRLTGQRHGLFDQAFGTALRTASEIILLLWALWWAIQLARTREVEQRAENRRKDQFLATLAHELRNPLAPIRTAAALIRKPQITSAQRTWCNDVIERQVQNMSLLLDDLLDVSRITRGALELRRAATELSAVVDTAIETARPLVDTRRHTLHVDVPAGMRIDVDPLRMAQVISNLLNNAARYTPEGGTLRLSAAASGDQLSIQVQDDGIGILPAEIETIFNMFTQVKAARAFSGGGLGIGLALTRALVELHGGTLSAHSEGAGKGSTFTVTLPGVLVGAQPAPLATEPASPVRYTGRPTPESAER